MEENTSAIKAWVLGSSSKWRRRNFRQHFDSAKFTAVDIDEKAIRHPIAELMTQKIARAKAEAIVAREMAAKGHAKCFEDEILVCCDEVIRFHGEIREKPETPDQCRLFLRSYKENPKDYVECVNGICVYFNGRYLSHYEISRVRFKNLDDAKIEELVIAGDVLGSAGGFVIEQMDVEDLIGSVEGIEGLPVKMVRELGSLCAHLSKYGHITHCVFGLDCLLRDREEEFIAAHQSVCKTFDRLFSVEIQQEIFGMGIDDACKKIIDILDLKVTQKEYFKKFVSTVEPLLGKTQFLPGAEAFLYQLKSLNIPMGVASLPRKLIFREIESLQKQFDLFSNVILSGDDLPQMKCNPFPIIFTEILRMLVAGKDASNLRLPKPERVMVFVSSSEGVRAARDVGMNVIMVPNKKMPKELRNECTLELETLEYLDFSQFIS